MHIAIIDCFAGISGDMTLATLIDWGVPVKYIKAELEKMGISHFNIEVKKTQRHHISATQVNVRFDQKMQPERNYPAIKKMIENSGLGTQVKKKALHAFKILGEAEAKIHDKELDKIHFHEVGAVDSIVDLVGSLIGFEYLKIDKIYGTSVPLGTGFTKTEHGNIPVPSPAAIEILKGYPTLHKNSDYEMTTPTGATLLKILVEEILPDFLLYKPVKISYGAGTKQTSKWPNLLRLISAETETNMESEFLQMIETNIDDLNPEIYPFIMEKLFEIGARDVFLTNIIMKKGRPGIKISVLADNHFTPGIEQILFENTTTLGIRKYLVDRKILPRKSKAIQTKWGEINVKEILYDGKKFYRPEFEECNRMAKKNNISILEVYRYIDNLNNEIL